jgi:hypothetical protein
MQGNLAFVEFGVMREKMVEGVKIMPGILRIMR